MHQRNFRYQSLKKLQFFKRYFAFLALNKKKARCSDTKCKPTHIGIIECGICLEPLILTTYWHEQPIPTTLVVSQKVTSLTHDPHVNCRYLHRAVTKHLHTRHNQQIKHLASTSVFVGLLIIDQRASARL